MSSSSLIPPLKPGDIDILDNLGSDKGEAVRKAVRAAEARLLFLPPYSPGLNPIEQVFAKLKTLLRKAAECSVEATWRRIGLLPDAFSAHGIPTNEWPVRGLHRGIACASNGGKLPGGFRRQMLFSGK